MDTGTAPVSGYVALYAIYNPTTQTAALFATNAATKQGNVYGGANMPAGYTASALVSVWPTNAGSQFANAYQTDREIYFPGVSVLSTTTTVGSATALSISQAVPANARSAGGNFSGTNSTANGGSTISLSGSASTIGAASASATSAVSGAGIVCPFNDVPLITAQTVYYTNVPSTSGISSMNVSVSKYTF